MTTHLRTLVMVLVLVVSVVSFAPVTGAVTKGAETMSHNEGQSPLRDRQLNNLTVLWEDNDGGDGNDPDPDVESVDRRGMQPGNKDVDRVVFSPNFPVDYTPMGNITTAEPAQEVWPNQNDCKVTQAAAFGIDRGNDGRPDDSSDDDKRTTYTDVTLVDKFEVNKNFTDPEGRNMTWLDFWDEGEAAGGFGDNSVNNFQNDEILSKETDCYNAPEQEGWYRFYGALNGSTDGDPEDSEGGDWRSDDWFGDDDDEIAAAYSHWWWVCDCENQEEAVETLGTPPNYAPTNSKALGAPNPWHNGQELAPLYHPGSTDGTATPTPTATPSDGTETATSTESGDTTATPTETEASDQEQDDTPTPTPTPAAEGTTEAAAEETTEATGGETTEPSTPGGESSSSAPGFGAVAALVALLAAALLARRRR